MFFDVAYQSYLPSLVDRADLVEGNAKLEVSQSTAQVAGPALSGFLIQVIGGGKGNRGRCGSFLDFSSGSAFHQEGGTEAITQVV